VHEAPAAPGADRGRRGVHRQLQTKARRRAGAERRLQALQGVGEHLLVDGRASSAATAPPGLLCDAERELFELGDADRQVLTALRPQLDRRASGDQRRVELDRAWRRRPWSMSRRARSASSSQRSVLAPGAEQRRQALLRAQCPESALAGPAWTPGVGLDGQLARVQPAAVGDLLALAPASPDRRTPGSGETSCDIRVRRGDPVECRTRLTPRTAASTSRSPSRSSSHACAWCSADSEIGSITVTRVVLHGAGCGLRIHARCAAPARARYGRARPRPDDSCPPRCAASVFRSRSHAPARRRAVSAAGSSRPAGPEIHGNSICMKMNSRWAIAAPYPSSGVLGRENRSRGRPLRLENQEQRCPTRAMSPGTCAIASAGHRGAARQGALRSTGKPAPDGRDRSRVRGPREGRPGPGGRAERPEYPLRRRHRTSDQAPALGLSPPGGDRGRRRPSRPRPGSPGGVEARLSAIEDQLRALASKLDSSSRPARASGGKAAARTAKPKATAAKPKAATSKAAKPKAAKAAKAKATKAKPKSA
jgi:hypothetical protein